MLTAKNQVFKPFFNIYSKMQKEKVNIRDQEAMGSSPVTPTTSPQASYRLRRLFVQRTPRLCRGFWKSFSDPYERKTPFGKMEVRPDNCTEIPKGGHSDGGWRMTTIVQHIQHGTANIISCLHQNIGERYSTKNTKQRQGKPCGNYATGKESIQGFLKGKSSILIHERHGNLKYKYGNRSFWCRGYYVDTAGKNTKKIAEYIQNQLKEDELHDQLTLKEYIDPFTGSK